MHASPLQGFLGHLRRLVDPARQRELSDADLLERFRLHREEAAFTLLVQRHGPMVLAVCRRILGDAHAAEDAFQATFLVLIRSADAIRKQSSLASWLHGVAVRLSRKAAMRATRQRTIEREILPPTVRNDPCETLAVAELRTVLDEEIERLPDKYRMPLVLCYVADKTHEQAALELGWPKSSLTMRLAKARELLQRRLRQRGFTAPAGLLAVLLTEATTNAALPTVLTLSTVRLAVQALTGQTLAATATVALADGFAKGSAVMKWTVTLTLLTALGLTAAVGHHMASTGSPAKQTEPASKVPAAVGEPRKPRLDLQGDPLPDGVVARLGSGRMRHFGVYPSRPLAFAPDGQSIVSGGSGSLRIWDAATGKRRRQFAFDGITDHCLDFVFHADTLTVVSGHGQKGLTIHVFDAAQGKVRRKVELPESDRVADPVLSRDGKRLAYAPEKNAVRIFELEAERETRRISFPGNWPWYLAFAPDGKTLAVSDSTDTLCLYHVATGKRVRELKRDKSNFFRLVFSPDGRLLASISEQRESKEKPPAEMSVWNVQNGEEIHRLKMPSGRIHCAAFSPDSKDLAAGGGHKEILLWDARTAKEIRLSSEGSISSLAFSPDGKSLATLTGAGTIQLRDAATGRILPVSADPKLDEIHDLRFSADGRRLLGIAGRYSAWEPRTGREIRRFADAPKWSVPYPYVSAYLSPDESLLAEADDEGAIHLRDATTGREVRRLKGHEKGINCVTFSPDGQHLFSTGNDEMIRVWEVKTGRCAHQWKSGGPLTRCMTASADGRWLASIRDGGGPRRQEVHLWDLASGQEKARFPSQRSRFLYHLAFSPDSRFLAGVGGAIRFGPGEVTVWTVPNGIRWRSLEGHKATVLRAAYSSDGRMLATGSWDGTLLLWELASGRLRHQFKGHESVISSLAFSPHGRLLAAASPEAPAYVWDVLDTLEAARHPLSPKELRRSWSELRSENAITAFQAIRRLAAVPEQTLPLLFQHLKPVPAPDPKRMGQLVQELDSDDFAIRQKATEELEKQADAAASLLREILAKEKPTLEVRKRLQHILDGLGDKPEALRTVRAVEILEWIGAPEAIHLLDEWAKGAEGARLTREAIAAKSRVAR